jgi:hypothetical protein
MATGCRLQLPLSRHVLLQLAASMNPYEANFSNTVARLGAWGRGMLRRYRRPLWAIVAATATMAIGVSAAHPPSSPPAAIAPR